MMKTKKVHFKPDSPIQIPSPDGETSLVSINTGETSKSQIITSEKVSDDLQESSDSIDREGLLEKVEMEKKLALIQAWEENEKSKAEAKAYKKLSGVGAWEVSKRAILEVELRVIEEKYEKMKAEKIKEMNNKQIEVQKAAEQKRAAIIAKRGEDVVMVEESAAKFRASGYVPKRLFSRFC
ncbi:remorin-like [Impatiens glandulifera]|uniref:remorin-like n=1 Tax=Impatiens glandulifera TaxID=253017 RepID=UPI001FB06099|nr:remorin-like [Impatiens glandulifera]